MRKYINISVLLSSLIAFFTLASCSKDVSHTTNLQKGITLNTTMGNNASRTVFNGSETLWADGDQMTVFISGNNYSTPSAHQFTIDTNDNNRFKNNTAEVDYTARYNFYAVYPHTAEIGENTTATIAIGAASQSQQGGAPSHIAALDPLTGYATEVLPIEVTIPMNHNAAVLAINITNNSEVEIAGIKSLQITTPDGVALCGSFDIDLATGDITAIGDVCNTTIININDSGVVENAASFKVYAAIAPIIIEAGKSLEFIVTTTDDVQHTFSKTFVEERVISAADLLTTTLTINKAEELPAEIIYEFDFTDYSTYPDGIENASGEKAYYTFGDKQIGLENAGGYAKGGTDKFLRFKAVSKTNSAKIYPPQLNGYNISQISITSSTGSNQFIASLYKEDVALEMSALENPTTTKNLSKNGTTTMELVTPVVVDYINIYSSNSTGQNYNCKNITIKYVKNN